MLYLFLNVVANHTKTGVDFLLLRSFFDFFDVEVLIVVLGIHELRFKFLACFWFGLVNELLQ